MKFRSMLAGILSRRNTASLAFIDPKLRALPLSPLLLSCKIKSRRIPDVDILLPMVQISYGGIIRIRYKGRR